MAVFPFSGADAESIQNPVMEVLREQGITVMTNLRPVDMAEQFRDMAATLNLAAYIDGKVRESRGKTSATIFLRSGYSGRRVASFVVSATRDELPGEIMDNLGKRMVPVLRRACADARRPHRTHAPMQINAGTPLENHPASEATAARDPNAPG